ncbi:ABC-type multidrug transport system ATPase subunit [Thermosporothrix hazakensis]|jgi:ABC-type multidrug transport system ATPase subunit|uniref:ABC-type multidrug transport system ATPase subunit n=2 Tax=Thermosporothrix TaxID=768650 RepID=A0A326U9C6_THEHA|nr:ABC transporter ATP-binding protein [Thermosporothrix hazakensis]PZW32731.1 ABC-type multidrug transport system ATPase subunit [Thermosporothrix hazakensis]BBH87646.1 multidrug ABC transporter ATP-binding protein [Thermosporothrix sp. COM3]GCE50089.1 multidrug ABC transporter ATP-binding protein [Thermosporothrix hazakensis]
MEIVIDHLTKHYGSYEALKAISVRIERGMFGLLGPNGAGKTTLLRILATLLQPTSGRVLAGAFDLRQRAQRKAMRASLGYLPQELSFYPELTGREFLDYMGLLKGLYQRRERRTQIDALLQLVNLTEKANQKVSAYTGGMKRRLGLAQALLGDPQVIVIDEPTAGLDPEERIRLRTLLTGLAEDRIVILSTHIVEDISQTCERLAVLDQGQLVFDGFTRQLTAAAEGATWQLLATPDAVLPRELSVISALPQRHEVLYRVVGPKPDGPVRAVQPVAPTLEDGYVWLRRQHAERRQQVSVF